MQKGSKMQKINKLSIVVEFKDGRDATLQKINDVKEYRGFWILINGEYYINTICSSNLKTPPKPEETGYSVGFEFTGNVIEHLHDKISNKKTLSKNEQKEFYEKVNLSDPIVIVSGKLISFKEILHKHTNIQFWTLKEKMTSKEKLLYSFFPVFADDFINLIGQ